MEVEGYPYQYTYLNHIRLQIVRIFKIKWKTWNVAAAGTPACATSICARQSILSA